MRPQLHGYLIVKELKKGCYARRPKVLVKRLRGRFLTKLQRTNIFHIMYVAKNYNASLPDRESLERLMTRELNENLKIDLVLEEGGALLSICSFRIVHVR